MNEAFYLKIALFDILTREKSKKVCVSQIFFVSLQRKSANGNERR